MLCSKTRGTGDPTCVASHNFHDKDFGRTCTHRRYIEPCLTDRYRNILRYRAKARAVVGDGEIIVDCLRHTNAGDGIAFVDRQLREFVGSVLRVSATVVEEIPNVMRLEYVHETFVFARVFLV